VLRTYDVLLINISGGKDSQAAPDVVVTLAVAASVRDYIFTVFCDLGPDDEWPGTRELGDHQYWRAQNRVFGWLGDAGIDLLGPLCSRLALRAGCASDLQQPDSRPYDARRTGEASHLGRCWPASGEGGRAKMLQAGHWQGRVWAVVLAVGLVGVSPTVGARAGARADVAPGACGSVLLKASAWLGGHGVAVESNGPDQGTGTSCGGTNTVDGITTGSEWQCTELVNRLYVTRGWINATWPGNGGRSSPSTDDSMYDRAPGSLSKQPNGSISYVGPGDVVSINVYENGVFQEDGHVLIVNATSKITSGNVPLVSQNGGDASDAVVTSSGSLSSGTLTIPASGAWSYSVIGVVHAPVAPGLRIIGVGSSNGSTQVFAIGTSGGDMYVDTEAGPGSKSWSGWQDIGGTWPAGDAIGVGSSNGSTQVFAIGTSGGDMYVDTEAGPGSKSWSGWQDIGGTWPSGDAIGVGSSNGSTQVFAIGTAGGGNMYVDTEAGPGSKSWSGWQNLGGRWP
jgi:hypothetical protein